LRISTYLGLFSGLIALFMAVLVLYWRLQQPDYPVTVLATILERCVSLGLVQSDTVSAYWGIHRGEFTKKLKADPLIRSLRSLGWKSIKPLKQLSINSC
jgi:dolichol-phosphate mannosyltransferase